MKRLLLMAPFALWALLLLSLFWTGIPLLAQTLSLSKKLPPGNVSSGEPCSAEATSAASLVVQNPLCQFHNLQGHGVAIATWLLIPLVGVFPLVPAWRKVKRRKAAIAATVLPLLLGLFLFLLESFTGYFIGKMLRHTDGVVHGTFARFAALHTLGFPLLIVIVLGFLLWVQVRLAKRATDI